MHIPPTKRHVTAPHPPKKPNPTTTPNPNKQTNKSHTKEATFREMEVYGKKSQQTGPKAEKDQTEIATGVGRRTREETYILMMMMMMMIIVESIARFINRP